MHDDQFTATGPSHPSSGKQKAAFSTVDFFDDNSNPSDFEFGIHVKARRVGVVGASAKGIAGVYGHGHTCKFGVLGIAMGESAEIGVVGASVVTTKDIMNLNVPSETVELAVGGDKIGVHGLSGTGPGVEGHSVQGVGVSALSREGVGVFARSEANVALHAVSDSKRAGVFESGGVVAQIKLVPLEQEGSRTELPKDGEVGDLIVIRNTVHPKPGEPISQLKPECSLWLCVSRDLIDVGGTPVWTAVWKEVQLGPPVKGTLPHSP
jgi:hypothetical protein